MKEAKPSEGKRVHPLTKIGYFLLTQGNRYANSFILLAGFALSGAFFVLGVNYVAPAFSYASRVNEALRQGIEFVSRDDALAAWQQAWLSVFLCLFCLGRKSGRENVGQRQRDLGPGAAGIRAG